jgi:hypothetical protein
MEDRAEDRVFDR